MYIAQQGILNTIYFPKELKSLDLIILVYDISDFNSFNICYEYFKKITLNVRYFPPVILIGFSLLLSERVDKGDNSFRQFLLQDDIRLIFKTDCTILEIEEEKNNALIIAKLKRELDNIDPAKIFREEPVIIVENKHKEFKESLNRIATTELSIADKIKIVYKIEERKKMAITKTYLMENYGWNQEIAINFINEWEKRLSDLDLHTIDEIVNIDNIDEANLSESDASKINRKLIRTSEDALERIQSLRSDVSLNSLLQLGYDLELSKQILYCLKKLNKIQSVSYHRESVDYENFKNINYFIVLYNYQHFYSKSLDENKCLLFSGLIQSIESIKDNFLKESEEYVPQYEKLIVEYLQFGEKFLVLVGNSLEGLKVIIRFRKKPTDHSFWENKVKAFMIDYLNEVPFDVHFKGTEHYQNIRLISEKIFYRYFNPFQSKLDNLLPIKLLDDNASNRTLSEREKMIIRYLLGNRTDPQKMLMENIIRGIVSQPNLQISRSDVILVLSELIKQRIIGQ